MFTQSASIKTVSIFIDNNKTTEDASRNTGLFEMKMFCFEMNIGGLYSRGIFKRQLLQH